MTTGSQRLYLNISKLKLKKYERWGRKRLNFLRKLGRRLGRKWRRK
jgi:hypothetical protein